MRRWNILCIGLLILTLLIPLAQARPTHAQVSFEILYQRVLDYLKLQIGRDFIVVQYTYDGGSWNDAALGCPVPGVSYAPGAVAGYVWNITIDGDQTFELHSNSDGSVVVLCTPIDRSQLINYRNYQGTGFLVDYPEIWQAYADYNATAVSFYPTNTPTCETPGISVQAVQSLGANANSLLNDAVTQAGLVQALGLATPTGVGGVTITFQVYCETTLQQYRITAFALSDGSGGFVLREWSTLVEYPNWDAVYLAIAESFTLTETLLNNDGDENETPTGVNTANPGEILSGYAIAHNFVADLYISQFDDLPGFRITRRPSERRGYKFSADGQYLAYIETSPTQPNERIEIVQGVNRPNPLSANVAPYYPVTWTSDGALIYLLPSADGATFEIHRVQPDAQNDTVLGSIPALTCETVTTPYISQNLYWQETGINGNPYILEALPDNRLLLTTDCNGVGLAFWGTDGTLTSIVGEEEAPLQRAALSGDKTQLAAVDANGKLYLVDVATNVATPIETPKPVDQLVWGIDNSQLFYSTIDTGDVIKLEDPAIQERAERILKVFPYESALNTLTMYSLDTATSESIAIWQGQGFAIGRMLVANNGLGIIFSLIPSDREYIEGFRSNIIIEELRFSLPETQIYWLSPRGGTAKLLLYSQQPVLSPVTVNDFIE